MLIYLHSAQVFRMRINLVLHLFFLPLYDRKSVFIVKIALEMDQELLEKLGYCNAEYFEQFSPGFTSLCLCLKAIKLVLCGG